MSKMKFSVYEVPFSIKLILRTFEYVTIGYCIASFNTRLNLKTNAIIYNIKNIHVKLINKYPLRYPLRI